MNKELIHKLETNLKEENYPKILIYLRQIFSKIDDLDSYDEDILFILDLIQKNFDLLVESERGKKNQMRLFLQKSLSSTFSEETFGKEKHSVVKDKIVQLIYDSSGIFHRLFYDPDFRNNQALKNILLMIYDRSPMIAEREFPFLFERFINIEDNPLVFHELLDKNFDLNPKNTLNIVFDWFKQSNVDLLDIIPSKIKQIDLLFNLFNIYCEIYPDYFSGYLDAMLQMLLKSLSEESRIDENIVQIMDNVTSMIYYFAKHGEYIIAEYAISLYNLSFVLQKNAKRKILLSIRELFENYPEEIVKLIISKDYQSNFKSGLFNLIEKTSERQFQDVLIDILFEFEIEMVKFNRYLDRTDYDKELISLEDIPSDEGDFISILTIIQDLNKNLGQVVQKFTYLLFKSAALIDEYVNHPVFVSLFSNSFKFSAKILEDPEFLEKSDEENTKKQFSLILKELNKLLYELKN